jgi:hypothetical protein
MSWEIQNKGFQTIFKMTWKYKDFIEFFLWNSFRSFFGHDFCGIYIFFSQTLNFKMFKRCPCNYFYHKITIRWCYILFTIKIQYKNVLLRIPHLPFLVHLKAFLPKNATSLGASPSLGGTIRNVTPWFS